MSCQDMFAHACLALAGVPGGSRSCLHPDVWLCVCVFSKEEGWKEGMQAWGEGRHAARLACISACMSVLCRCACSCVCLCLPACVYVCRCVCVEELSLGLVRSVLLQQDYSSRHAEACTSSHLLQCETGHLGLLLGQKLSKLSLEDHCSRDPVQVQSSTPSMWCGAWVASTASTP